MSESRVGCSSLLDPSFSPLELTCAYIQCSTLVIIFTVCHNDRSSDRLPCISHCALDVRAVLISFLVLSCCLVLRRVPLIGDGRCRLKARTNCAAAIGRLPTKQVKWNTAPVRGARYESGRARACKSNISSLLYHDRCHVRVASAQGI